MTLLITSSSAIVGTGLSSTQQSTEAPERGNSENRSARAPRHFMVISKPCVHPDCPLRDGFIRGQYESIEFIQEIPVRPKKSSSAVNLLSQTSSLQPQEQAPSIERAALVRNAHQKLDQGGSGDEMLDSMQITDQVPLAKSILVEEGRKRGKTISFAESRGYEAKGEAVDNLSQAKLEDPAEQNPVEWVMITRSDPGGSVPRFMVERGTPSGIVADAGKFVDWASKKDHPVKDDYGENREGSEAINGCLAGLHDEFPVSAESSQTLTNDKPPYEATPSGGSTAEEGVLSTLANAAIAGVENYAPQALIDRLPQHRTEDASSAADANDPKPPPTNALVSHPTDTTPLTAISSATSFASAEDHFTDFSSTKSRNSTLSSKDKVNAPGSPPQDKQFAKLTERKRTLDERLAKTREEVTQNKETLTSRGEERMRKAEEKYAREVAKQEARFRKEVSKLEAKRAKDAAKEAERKRRAEDRDEKLRLTRERDEARREAEKLREEREMLREQVGALQRENTALVAKLGKMEMGKTLLGEVQREVEKGGRSRSSSLRKGREGRGTDATVSGGEGGLKDSSS